MEKIYICIFSHSSSSPSDIIISSSLSSQLWADAKSFKTGLPNFLQQRAAWLSQLTLNNINPSLGLVVTLSKTFTCSSQGINTITKVQSAMEHESGSSVATMNDLHPPVLLNTSTKTLKSNQCSQCNYSSLYPNDLKNHIRMHIGNETKSATSATLSLLGQQL